jgi:hypothetical protein
MSHIIISLDGNIGAGKSTLLNHIRTYLHDIHVVDEPVGQWTELHDKEGKNLLELFYEVNSMLRVILGKPPTTCAVRYIAVNGIAHMFAHNYAPAYYILNILLSYSQRKNLKLIVRGIDFCKGAAFRSRVHFSRKA